MTEFKKGDLVTPIGSNKLYRIISVSLVFNILSADLIVIRKKDGEEGINRGRRLKNLPVSCLEKVN